MFIERRTNPKTKNSVSNRIPLCATKVGTRYSSCTSYRNHDASDTKYTQRETSPRRPLSSPNLCDIYADTKQNFRSVYRILESSYDSTHHFERVLSAFYQFIFCLHRTQCTVTVVARLHHERTNHVNKTEPRQGCLGYATSSNSLTTRAYWKAAGIYHPKKTDIPQ